MPGPGGGALRAESRVIGFDDSPFTRPEGRVPVVGVHMRGGLRVEGVYATDVARDGDDATARVARCVQDANLHGLKAILLDGASFAGFNVVDLEGLHRETGVSCLAFTRGVPDMDAMRDALRHVPNPEAKWALLARRERVTLPTASTPITISFTGMDRAQAVDLLALTTVRGLVPEPLRIAHLVASVLR